MFKNDFTSARNKILKALKEGKKESNHKLRNITNSLAPQRCVLCQSTIYTSPELLICDYCDDSLTRINMACAICSTPMNSVEEICGVCLKTNRYWSLCTAAYQYCEPISLLIHQFKYQHELRLKYTLCHALIERLRLQHNLPDLLIPVPMHYSRLAKRGYSHSLILAETLSESLNIPVINAVKKVRETPSLAKLSSTQRAKEIKQSFQLDSTISKNLLKDKHIAIIDDVVTTGTTSSEVAKVLQQAKPKDIEVWCIART